MNNKQAQQIVNPEIIGILENIDNLIIAIKCSKSSFSLRINKEIFIQQQAKLKGILSQAKRELGLLKENSEEWETMSNHIGIGLGKIFTEKSKSEIPKDNYECLEMAEKMCKENSEILMKRIKALEITIKSLEEVE